MNLDASKAKLIGLDWGTSSLRAYLLDAQGMVLDRIYSSDGIMQIQDGSFESTLCRMLDHWLQVKRLPIIASGMITSRNGWYETAYLKAPSNVQSFAKALTKIRTSVDLDLHFVTGLSAESGTGPDVMRGEETQIIGAAASNLSDSFFVLPGTHSKWVSVKEGRIEFFCTYMTGEIFAALREHTILGKLMCDADFNDEGFSRGVNDGFEAGSQLLHKLFLARTLPLFDLMQQDQVSDYLSGMLIGAEIHGAIDNGLLVDPVTIIGNHSLANRYAIALKLLGKNISIADDDIVARGHYEIAKSARIMT